MKDDKDGAIGCGQGKCEVVPTTLKATLNSIILQMLCVVPWIFRALDGMVVGLTVGLLIPLVHGWGAWTIVATIAIGIVATIAIRTVGGYWI